MLKYFFELNQNGGGIKTPGYVLCFALLFIILFLSSKLSCHRNLQKKNNTRELVFCAICMALGFVLSYVKIFEAPMGGSITLMSTFFITFVGYLYGTYTGIITGIAYGLLQLIAKPYFVHPVQILLDYPIAFGALGLSGLFSKSRLGYIKGYLIGITGRLFFAVLSGVVFFASYAGDQNVFWYSFTYNLGYIGIEALITIALLSIPVVTEAIHYVRKIALEQ